MAEVKPVDRAYRIEQALDCLRSLVAGQSDLCLVSGDELHDLLGIIHDEVARLQRQLEH